MTVIYFQWQPTTKMNEICRKSEFYEAMYMPQHQNYK